MKNYISIIPIYAEETAGLTNAVCKQLGIPCNGMSELGNFNNQRDFINLIASKYNIKDANVANETYKYSAAINLIANTLVNRNILDEGVLEQDLKEFLLKYPPLRL